MLELRPLCSDVEELHEQTSQVRHIWREEKCILYVPRGTSASATRYKENVFLHDTDAHENKSDGTILNQKREIQSRELPSLVEASAGHVASAL